MHCETALLLPRNRSVVSLMGTETGFIFGGRQTGDLQKIAVKGRIILVANFCGD